MIRNSRRRFLEESMIATAAVAAANATKWVSADDAPPVRSANETIRHAVLGCRIRGRVHAKEFAALPGVEIAYVCDPDSQLAEELAVSVEKQQGKKPQTVADMRKIFDDKSVDTVSVATPNHWHSLAAIWAMQSGKDVYVEKPVSHNITEGRRMVQVSRKTGRICQGGTQNRSRGDLAAAAEFLRAGNLGKIHLARSIIYGQRGSIGAPGKYDPPSHVDYNLFMGPAELSPLSRPQLHYDWHWQWNTGNGELGNNNIHMIDMCRLLIGLTGLGDTAWSLGGRFGYQDAGETPNTQLVVHTFGDITIIQEVRGLKSDPFSKDFKAGAIVHGSEGFLAESSFFDRQGKLVKTFSGPGENHFANFLKVVRNRKREEQRAEILEGHQSTALCHLGNISYRLGEQKPASEVRPLVEANSKHEEVVKTFDRLLEHLQSHGITGESLRLQAGPVLKLDSERETILDLPAALPLLTRTYRAPFVVPAENAI